MIVYRDTLISKKCLYILIFIPYLQFFVNSWGWYDTKISVLIINKTDYSTFYVKYLMPYMNS